METSKTKRESDKHGQCHTATSRSSGRRNSNRQHIPRPASPVKQNVQPQVLKQIATDVLDHTKRLGLFDEMRIKLIEDIESSGRFDKIEREFKRDIESFCINADLSLPRTKLREKLLVSRSMNNSRELLRDQVMAYARKHKEHMRQTYQEKARAYLQDRLPTCQKSKTDRTHLDDPMLSNDELQVSCRSRKKRRSRRSSSTSNQTISRPQDLSNRTDIKVKIKSHLNSSLDPSRHVVDDDQLDKEPSPTNSLLSNGSCLSSTDSGISLSLVDNVSRNISPIEAYSKSSASSSSSVLIKIDKTSSALQLGPSHNVSTRDSNTSSPSVKISASSKGRIEDRVKSPLRGTRKLAQEPRKVSKSTKKKRRKKERKRQLKKDKLVDKQSRPRGWTESDTAAIQTKWLPNIRLSDDDAGWSMKSQLAG